MHTKFECNCQQNKCIGFTFNSLIACASNSNNIQLCDIDTGSSIHSLIGHKYGVNSIEWNPVNQFVLASASNDKCIRFYIYLYSN